MGNHRRPRGDDDIMTVPPRIDHTKPVPDSRGLVRSPASLPEAWSGPRSGPVAVLDPCPTLAPRGTCASCGETDTEIVVRWKPPAPPSSEIDLSPERALVESYQLCADMGACFDHRRAREAAQRAQEATEPPTEAPTPPGKAPARKRPTRPSKARSSLQAKTGAAKEPAVPSVEPSTADGTAEPPDGGAA